MASFHPLPFPPLSSQHRPQLSSPEVLRTVPCFHTLAVKEVASGGAACWFGVLLSFEGPSDQNAARLGRETKKNASVAAIDKLERIAGVGTTGR